MLGVARAIDRLAVPLTLYRTQPATYVDHKAVLPPPVEQAIRGAIQPGQAIGAAKGNQLLDLPEGVRVEATWLLWTRAAIAENDVVKTADGRRYRVIWLWPREEGGFTRATIALLT